MPFWALGLCLAYVLVVFGLKTVEQLRDTGSSGWLPGFGATSAERVANCLFLVSCALDVLGPALVLLSVLSPVGAIDRPGVHALGFVLFAVALAGARSAQLTMGSAGERGIDPTSAPSALVTTGLFGLVRNPVYTTMVATSLGVALLVPTLVALVAVPARIVGLEVQARLVEEPFLLQRHGRDYAAYASRVGRFLPRLGRLHKAA